MVHLLQYVGRENTALITEIHIILQYIHIENSYFYNDISLFLIQEMNLHLTDPKPLISSVRAKSNLNELIVIFSKDALH